MHIENLSLQDTLDKTARLLAVFALVQGMEFLFLNNAFGDKGIWKAQDLAEDYGAASSLLRKCASFLLRAKVFTATNLLRVAIAASVLWSPSAVGLSALLFCHVHTLIRCRGTFNGGSDSMFLYVCLGAMLGLAFPTDPMIPKVAVWLISLNLIYSYVKAGLLKVSKTSWRNGQALQLFMTSPIYQSTAGVSDLASSALVMKISSWTLILFEILFPLSLINQKVGMTFLCLGAIFHLANAFAFGLNRFLFAWISAYPALLYCAS
jgi:hypothetical protein